MMQFARLEPPTALSLIGATALNTYSKRINHRKIYEKYYNVKIGKGKGNFTMHKSKFCKSLQ